MVKDHILSYCGQYKRARILTSTHMVLYIIKDIVLKIWIILLDFSTSYLFPTLFTPRPISGIYGVVVTSKNSGDKAQQWIAMRVAKSEKKWLPLVSRHPGSAQSPAPFTNHCMAYKKSFVTWN